MNILVQIFAAAIAIAAALATLAIWAPRPTRIRVLAVVITAIYIPVAYVQFLEILSRPKPMTFEWYERATKKAVLLGVSLHEKESIYVWLRPFGSIEPRYYVIPWNLKLAEKLQKATSEATRGNSTVVLEDPFQRRSLEEWGDLNVEIVPPPLPPVKHPPPPPRFFNPRGEQI